MKFVVSKEMKIELTKDQQKQLSSKEKINKAIKSNKVIAFDIYDDNNLVGFAMLRKYKTGYFLWDYAIDYRYQNKGYGYKALIEMAKILKEKYKVNEMSTTYKWGNEHAKHVYEKVGFVETSIVDEDDVHEVNMIYRF